MEIQNISGPDAVPSGFTVRNDIPVENANPEREETVRREESPEPSKGRSIDTYA